MKKENCYIFLILVISTFFIIAEASFAIWPFGSDEEEHQKSREQLESDLDLAEKQLAKAETQVAEQQRIIEELQKRVQQHADLENHRKALEQQLQTALRQSTEYQQYSQQLHKEYRQQRQHFQEQLAQNADNEILLEELREKIARLEEQVSLEHAQATAYQESLQQLRKQRRLTPFMLSAVLGLSFIAYRVGVMRRTSRRKKVAKSAHSPETGSNQSLPTSESEQLAPSPSSEQIAEQSSHGVQTAKPASPPQSHPLEKVPARPSGLTEFAFTPEMIERITREIPENTGKTPTASQWKMILSSSPNTYVVAGAGSGKSTSLILRVLVLNHYLRIPLKQITVFSFTRESTKEFRQKLREVFQAYGKRLSKQEAAQVVRTFHSKILELARGHFPQNTLFEFLSARNDLGDSGIFESSLNDVQEEYLKMVYKALFHDDDDFRAVIRMLYQEYLDSQNLDGKTYSEEILKIAAERDADVTKAVEDVFTFPYGEQRTVSFPLSGIYQHMIFHANAYVPELDWYIIFIPQTRLLGNRKDQRIRNFPLGGCLTVKKNIVIKFSDVQVKFIHNEKDLSRITEEIAWIQDDGHQFTPIFPYAIAGELSSAVIWEAFYAIGLFVESMGLEVDELGALLEYESVSQSDKLFVQALMPYWTAFNQKLKTDRMIRFHEYFRFLSEKHPEHFEQLSRSMLESMSHVLIDEFQDISPEVVAWIRGITQYQQAAGISSSLLCVGDDWQSIYGWKGSSPRYFIEYEHEFPGPHTLRVDMLENFRSYQDIIDQAERILSDVGYKIQKHGKAVRGAAPEGEAVHIFPTDDIDEVFSGIRQILRNVREPSHRILLMARSNSVLRRLRTKFQGSRHVKILTYHQSKGLEADVCILVGDCLYNSTIPLKNAIYDLAGFPQTYDQAQADEALRLGYVAVTRAKDRCFWIAAPKSGGALTRIYDEEPEEWASMSER